MLSYKSILQYVRCTVIINNNRKKIYTLAKEYQNVYSLHTHAHTHMPTNRENFLIRTEWKSHISSSKLKKRALYSKKMSFHGWDKDRRSYTFALPLHSIVLTFYISASYSVVAMKSKNIADTKLRHFKLNFKLCYIELKAPCGWA